MPVLVCKESMNKVFETLQFGVAIGFHLEEIIKAQNLISHKVLLSNTKLSGAALGAFD